MPRRDLLTPSFLNKYGKGQPGKIKYIPLEKGFLKLNYEDFLENDEGILENVSFVKSKKEEPEGRQLYFFQGGDHATFKAEMDYSGETCSRDSGPIIGTVFEDDLGPAEPEKISFEDWIDRCVEAIIKEVE